MCKYNIYHIGTKQFGSTEYIWANIILSKCAICKVSLMGECHEIFGIFISWIELYPTPLINRLNCFCKSEKDCNNNPWSSIWTYSSCLHFTVHSPKKGQYKQFHKKGKKLFSFRKLFLFSGSLPEGQVRAGLLPVCRLLCWAQLRRKVWICLHLWRYDAVYQCRLWFALISVEICARLRVKTVDHKSRLWK